MNKRIKRQTGFILVLTIILIFAGCSKDADNQTSSTGEGSDKLVPMSVRIGTSASGSVNHTVASGFANILKKAVDVYDLVPEVTTGSQENIRLLYSKSALMGFGMLDVVKYGYEGGREFSQDEAPDDPFRYVVGASPTIIHIFVPANSPANTITDLKGKKWGAGMGAMTQYYTPIILEAYGLSESDINKVDLQLNDICAAVADGTVNVGLWITPPGSAPIADLAQTRGIKLLEIDQAAADKIIQEHPYFHYTEIPGGTYHEVDDPVKSIATVNVIIAAPELDEEYVYNFTKAVCENKEELSIIHPRAAEYCTENALKGDGVIPMHPGAERYYKEIGLK